MPPSIANMITGTYNDDCRKAVAELPRPKTGRVDIKILEMESDQIWWLRIVFDLVDFIQLTESEQYKWAGYIKDLQSLLIKQGKLVEVYRTDRTATQK